MSDTSLTTTELGARRGCFNSAIRFKSIALPSIPHQLTHRGKRRICLHSQRYLPPVDKQRTLSDSAVHVDKLQNCQQLNLINRQRDVEMAERRKYASPHHQVMFNLHMTGNSARMFRRNPFLSEEDQVEQTPVLDTLLNPKSSLYYGQGLRMGSRRPHSNILEQRLHHYLKAVEQDRTGATHAPAKTDSSLGEIQESHLESSQSNSSRPLELTGINVSFGRNRRRVFLTEQH